MKKQISSVTFLFCMAVLYFFNSCKKQDQENIINKETISKVILWLKSQRSKADENNVAKIQQLEDKLDYSNLYFENLADGERFIVVPVKEGLKTVNNHDKKPSNALVLIEDNSGSIRRGNIVQYIPAQEMANPGIPKNSFTKIFTAQKIDADAQFFFLTITDRLLYQVKYKDGERQSYGIAKPGTQSTTANKPTQDPITIAPCTDWYLVTTYFYEDGSTSQTETYLYTTCDSGGGGGEPGDGNDEAFEYELWKYADLTWDVLYVPPTYGGGIVISDDRFYGRVYPNHPERNKFLSGDHLNNRLLGNSKGGTFYCGTWGITVNSPLLATAVCGGEIAFSNQRTIPVNNSKAVAFSSLSWE